jgi:putative heme-binding domain-containing protein
MLASLLLASAVHGQGLGLRVPAGFEVTQYADDALATDISSLAIDAKGRVVVAGPNYIKILVDTKNAGKADQAILFSKLPKSGAHGIACDGNDVIASGDMGVRRYIDRDGDGVCDEISEPWIKTAKDSEHGANAIVKGPDGWFYMITGNDAGISDTHATTPNSPLKMPHMGSLVRMSPDGKHCEVLAHGFRNPYGLGINVHGHFFTVDADGERVHHLPYYAPTRLFDIAQGRHHGWVNAGWQGGWSRPAYFPDSVERLVEIGRGSPTGLCVYRHHAFPEKYRGGVFSACWTFGKVYFLPLRRPSSEDKRTKEEKKEVPPILDRDSASYASGLEEFMTTTGDVGFAPTGMAVGPEGELFVAIGGRGTRGGVFRIRYLGKKSEDDPLILPVVEVLTAPEPLSAWSRARWVPAAKKLGAEAFEKELLRRSNSIPERIRAAEVLTELFGGVRVAIADKLLETRAPPEVLARAAWSVSLGDEKLSGVHFGAHWLMDLLKDEERISHPLLARAVWEGLQRHAGYKSLAPRWRAGLGHPDSRVRWAALRLAQEMGPDRFRRSAIGLPKSHELTLAHQWVASSGEVKDDFDACLAVLSAAEANKSMKLEALRIMQMRLGDIQSTNGEDASATGYTARTKEGNAPLDPALRLRVVNQLALSDAGQDVDFEIARLAAMLGVQARHALLEAIARRLSSLADAKPSIHYLLCLAQMTGERDGMVTSATARAVNSIHAHLAKERAVPADQVPGILEAMFDNLLEKDPALAKALVADPLFGVPGHELFANRLPLEHKQDAARKMLASFKKRLGEDELQAAWSPDFVRLVASLPDAEALPLLRDKSREPRLADGIALILAARKHPEDRGRLIDALGSLQGKVVLSAATSLLEMKGDAKPADLVHAIKALRRFTGKEELTIRTTLAQLLAAWSKETLDDGKDGFKAAGLYTEWLAKHHPAEAKALTTSTLANAEIWKKRLAGIDWNTGDAKRGEAVFHKRNCFRCHGEARRLGPDLAGVGQRFSVADLFTAIVDPSKDIAPSYRASSVITHSGKVHGGLVIYSSQELVLLQTALDTTVRIVGTDVQSIQPSPISFMPTGLLDDAADGELADLAAYLRLLKKAP